MILMSGVVPEYSPFRSASARAEYLAHYQDRARSWPVEVETRTVDTPSGHTFLRISGSLSSPPMVLLPGSRDHSLTWIPIIEALSARFRTYALDTIYDVGISYSSKPLKKPADLVAWLSEVVDVLSPGEPVILAGISYGGWLVSQYTLRFPQRVQKLVLLAPAATVLPVSFSFLLHALSMLLPGRYFVKEFLYWLLDDTVKSGEAGRAFVDRAVEDWMVAKRSFGPLPLIAATVLPDEALCSFPVPTLYLDGEHEKVYSAQKAVARLARLAPQIQAGILPGAGHDLWIVQNEPVAQRILDFLSIQA